MLLEAGAHGFLNSTDVLVEPDNERVIVHALHVGDDGVVPLFSQRDQVVEAMNSVGQKREMLQCHNPSVKIPVGMQSVAFLFSFQCLRK